MSDHFAPPTPSIDWSQLPCPKCGMWGGHMPACPLTPPTPAPNPYRFTVSVGEYRGGWSWVIRNQDGEALDLGDLTTEDRANAEAALVLAALHQAEIAPEGEPT